MFESRTRPVAGGGVTRADESPASAGAEERVESLDRGMAELNAVSSEVLRLIGALDATEGWRSPARPP